MQSINVTLTILYWLHIEIIFWIYWVKQNKVLKCFQLLSFYFLFLMWVLENFKFHIVSYWSVLPPLASPPPTRRHKSYTSSMAPGFHGTASLPWPQSRSYFLLIPGQLRKHWLHSGQIDVSIRFLGCLLQIVGLRNFQQVPGHAGASKHLALWR
jgi:hypothetical protein